MVINIGLIFLRGEGDCSERVQFGYMEGVGCGWGGLKIGGQREGFLWSTKYSERI